MTLDCLESPVKKMDEKTEFREALRSLGQRAPTELNQLIQMLGEEKKKFVTDLFQLQKVDLGNNQ